MLAWFGSLGYEVALGESLGWQRLGCVIRSPPDSRSQSILVPAAGIIVGKRLSADSPWGQIPHSSALQLPTVIRSGQY